MASSERVSFERLSRRHGIKIAPVMNCSVEDCSLAVGQIVGHDSIMSASRMNSAVVIFLDNVEKVNRVVENGISIQDTFTPVIPLVQPAKKIILSNVPPFIKDDLLIAELSRHGKIVSQMRKVPLGCKSPLLKHVVSFRRQIFMVLKSEVEDLSLAFKFKIDGFDYVVYASSETMKCFKCGSESHIRSSCRVQSADDSTHVEADEEVVDAGVSGSAEADQAEGASAVPEAGASTAAEGEPELIEEETVIDAVKAAKRVTGEEIITDYVGDEALFKTPPVKRKRNKAKMRNEKSKQWSETQVDECDDVESSPVEDSDSETQEIKSRRNTSSDYSFDKVKSFLQRSKNVKNVQVTDSFPDRKMFVDSVVMLMRSEGEEKFTVQEIYRLRKIIAKLRSELQAEDGFETM